MIRGGAVSLEGAPDVMSPVSRGALIDAEVTLPPPVCHPPSLFSEGGEVIRLHTVGSLTIPITGIKMF